MADTKTSALTTRGTPDRANDQIMIQNSTSNYRSTINNELGISGNPVGDTDSQTLSSKTLTNPTINAATFSGTLSGTYTIGGTPTFPSSVVTLTGSQTLTNKVLTSPTINTPTITNATITQDAVVGFSSANSGTVYGIAITSSKMSGASLTNSTVGPNQLATGAQSATVATLETTTSTSYADLTTTSDSVTVTIGANGIALVVLTCDNYNSTSGSFTKVSFVVSGSNTIAATDANAIINKNAQASDEKAWSWVKLFTGLSPGSTTFKMKYSVNANTGNFANRSIAVIPL